MKLAFRVRVDLLIDDFAIVETGGEGIVKQFCQVDLFCEVFLEMTDKLSKFFWLIQ